MASFTTALPPIETEKFCATNRKVESQWSRAVEDLLGVTNLEPKLHIFGVCQWSQGALCFDAVESVGHS